MAQGTVVAEVTRLCDRNREGRVAAYSASSTSLELVQAASGCAPSVEDLAIFDVKQAECRTNK